MTKYHINPKGDVTLCRAKVKCRFGSEDVHFSSKSEALTYFEDNSRTFTKIKKGLHVSDSLKSLEQPHSNVLILSDVDGTLVKGSLVLNHACALHDKGVIDLGDLPEKWKADMKNEVIIQELAETYRDKIIGLHLKDLETKEFIDEVVSDSNNFYSSIDEIRTMKRGGAEVILISGSPQYLVGELAKKFGFKGIGSDYQTDRTGHLNGKVVGMFFAEAKEKVVAESIDLNEHRVQIHAYGDTSSDKPLFDKAHHKVIVDPTSETLRKLNIRKNNKDYRILKD